MSALCTVGSGFLFQQTFRKGPLWSKNSRCREKYLLLSLPSFGLLGNIHLLCWLLLFEKFQAGNFMELTARASVSAGPAAFTNFFSISLHCAVPPPNQARRCCRHPVCHHRSKALGQRLRLLNTIPIKKRVKYLLTVLNTQLAASLHFKSRGLLRYF